MSQEVSKMQVELAVIIALPHVRFGRYSASRYLGRGNWDYFDTIEEGKQASYGSFEHVELSELRRMEEAEAGKLYLMHELFEGSDYSNGAIVQRSNLKAFMEEYGSSAGVHELFGGHGTFALAVRLDCLTEDMLDTFRAIEDYPVYDDSLLSEMELEEQQEAWSNWARGDFERALQSELSVSIDDTGDRFLELFNHCAEEANEYWFEDGASQYIHVDRVAEKATRELLDEYGIAYTPEDDEETEAE